MTNRVTMSGQDPDPTYDGPAPQPIDPVTGMHKDYWVLSAEERAKGFVRPVRDAYRHVGTPGPTYPVRDLTEEELAQHGAFGYVQYEAYPPERAPVAGRFWSKEALDAVGKGCGGVTRMGVALAETYARDPRFYTGTFCATCRAHFPVGAQGEFVWDGTNQRVGT